MNIRPMSTQKSEDDSNPRENRENEITIRGYVTEPNQYLNKLDTEKPGVFVAHLNAPLLAEVRSRILTNIENKIKKFSPESEVLLLGPEFDSTLIKRDKESS